MKNYYLAVLFLMAFVIKNGTCQFNSTNGIPFSPHGDMRVLIIEADYTNYSSTPCVSNTQANNFWPQTAPNCTDLIPSSIINQIFYNSYSQFSNTATDKTISNFYYTASKNNPNRAPFRVVADVFPYKINIGGGGVNNYAVFNKIATDYPNFDFTPYDKRVNNPNGTVDNSVSPQPDGYLDYVIIVWRNLSDPLGYASIDYNYNGLGTGNPLNGTGGKKVLFNCGFTILCANRVESLKKIFLHEVAHTLYNAPHTWGVNGVYGQYFNATSGWGQMAYGEINSTSLSWESWYLGWIDLPVYPSYNSLGRDLSSFSQNGTYTLKDFATTGDAMRIKLPFTTNQYLWLENHAGISPFDTRDGAEFNSTTKDRYGNLNISQNTGILMYVEKLADQRTTQISSLGLKYANTFKALHSGGNFDYWFQQSDITTSDLVYIVDYGNPYYKYMPTINFHKTANPTSAHNPLVDIRSNYNNYASSLNGAVENLFPDKILVRDFTNGKHEGNNNSCLVTDFPGTVNLKNEVYPTFKEDGVYTNGFNGEDMSFPKNGTFPSKIGLGSNPLITNHQLYDPGTKKLENIKLSGLSINFVSKAANGDITIEVKFDDTKLLNNQMFTGSLEVSDVPNAPIDLEVVNSTLTLDLSKTPNRHTKLDLYPLANDFINPSELILNNGANIVFDHSQVNIFNQSSVIVKNGSNLTLKNQSNLLIDTDSKVCIENISNFVMNDNSSISYYRPGGYVDGFSNLNRNVIIGSTIPTASIDMNNLVSAFESIVINGNGINVQGATTNPPTTLNVELKAGNKIRLSPGAKISGSLPYSKRVGIRIANLYHNCPTNVSSTCPNTFRLADDGSYGLHSDEVSTLSKSDLDSDWYIKIAEPISSNTSDLSIYPNPNNGKFVLKGKEMENFNKIEIFDLSGLSISSLNYKLNDEIDLGNIKKGVYFIKLSKDDGNSKSLKVVII